MRRTTRAAESIVQGSEGVCVCVRLTHSCESRDTNLRGGVAGVRGVHTSQQQQRRRRTYHNTVARRWVCPPLPLLAGVGDQKLKRGEAHMSHGSQRGARKGVQPQMAWGQALRGRHANYAMVRCCAKTGDHENKHDRARKGMQQGH